jgi:hypothetical protein
VLIAAEYIDGHTLREIIASGVRPSGAELLQTARGLASALAAAHARGVTHRDLKPENVMRAVDGELKILDFGLAIVAAADGASPAARVTTPGSVVGTPAYMAPEQLNGGSPDVRTDIFALGVLLYEYATGAHPFDAATPLALAARILESEPEALAKLRADVPPVFAGIVERCLRKKPEDRFASAAAVVAALADGGRTTAPAGVVTWWRTHLAIAIGLYLAAAGAAWVVKEWQHGLTDPGFVVAAILATVGGVFRGHLLFAERTHTRAAFLRELRRAGPILAIVDVALAAITAGEGLWVARARPLAGVLIVALGVGIALARLVLERSTTEAAFGERT